MLAVYLPDHSNTQVRRVSYAKVERKNRDVASSLISVNVQVAPDGKPGIGADIG